MKKTLAALAVLGAFAGTAAAADVTLYGVVDTGLAFTYQKVTNSKGDSTEMNTFEMANGINAGSRFGLRGTEELGNGFKVGFKLENGFNSDDGSLKFDNRLFGREASLTIYTPHCGQVSFGRMGGIGSAAGTYDVVFANADAFDGGDWDVFGFSATSRYDNMVTYQTPKVVGLQATMQYSFKTDSTKDGVEGRSTANRYGSVALTGEYGPVTFVGAYEEIIRPTTEKNVTDGRIASLGGNVDLGVAKIFAMAQYLNGLTTSELGNKVLEGVENTEMTKYGFEGYGLHLGTVAPIAGGDLTVGVYYVDGVAHVNAASNRDFDYLGLAARYGYSLSKRTTAYVGGGYAEQNFDKKEGEAHDGKVKTGTLYVGLTHTF